MFLGRISSFFEIIYEQVSDILITIISFNELCIFFYSDEDYCEENEIRLNAATNSTYIVRRIVFNKYYLYTHLTVLGILHLVGDGYPYHLLAKIENPSDSKNLSGELSQQKLRFLQSCNELALWLVGRKSQSIISNAP